MAGKIARFPLLLLLGFAAVAAGEPETKTTIPAFARMAGVDIGLSTQADLAKRWGEGKTVTGGHSNSGRVWRVKGAPWILQTDGFEYSSRGLVVDSLSLHQNAGSCHCQDLLDGAPETRAGKEAFAWSGHVVPGMSKDAVMLMLRDMFGPVTVTGDGCEVKAAGFSPLTSIATPFRAWTTSFVFTNGVLSRLSISAEAGKP
jgi:hypothetical protein